MVEFGLGVGARGGGAVSPSALSSLAIGPLALAGAVAVPLTCDVDVVAPVPFALAELVASVMLAVPFVLAEDGANQKGS